MKNRLFLAMAVLAALAAASCGSKKKSVTEQMVGLWAGIDTVRITTVDSTGSISVETLAIPVLVEYYADTTLSGKMNYNDSTAAEISAVVLVGDPYVTYSGVMNINDAKQDIKGKLYYRETPESLTMEFFSKNPATGAEHKGKALLQRKPRESSGK